MRLGHLRFSATVSQWTALMSYASGKGQGPRGPMQAALHTLSGRLWGYVAPERLTPQALSPA